MSEASQWMLQQMENHGYVEPQSPRTHHLWGLSVVLSAAALNGTAYLKCSGDHFRSEPVVTRALAERSPELLPEVIAIDEDRGWLLMRDLGAGPLGPQPESTWGRGLDALARLQKQWQGRTDDLLASGAQDRPLEVLAAWVDNTETDTDLLAPMTREERETWLASVPTMVDSCHRLAAIGPEPTLVHGDFHPWNVVCSETETRIFDWTDASVGHPFLDVATYVMRSTSTDVRPAMLHNYLGEWAADLRGESVDDVGHLALVVGALHQAHTYSRLIPTVMPDDLGDLGGGDAQWLRRAMRFSVDGIRSAY
jgi:fructosamine-3-kinase